MHLYITFDQINAFLMAADMGGPGVKYSHYLTVSAAACPFCITMLTDGIANPGKAVKVKDSAEKIDEAFGLSANADECIQDPVSSIEYPESRIEQPVSNIELPATRNSQLVTRNS